MYMNVRACIQRVEGINTFWVFISMIIKGFFFQDVFRDLYSICPVIQILSNH